MHIMMPSKGGMVLVKLTGEVDKQLDVHSTTTECTNEGRKKGAASPLHVF